ncbi:hypothetical protein L1887_47415 [Cichorium endivia]|nr:hypothetical protein L1887_47415 [Cichorium endivia]
MDPSEAISSNLSARYARTMIVNLWRPVGGTVYDKPLALADYRSLDQRFISRHANPFGCGYDLHAHDKQQWHFVPHQTNHERLCTAHIVPLLGSKAITQRRRPTHRQERASRCALLPSGARFSAHFRVASTLARSIVLACADRALGTSLSAELRGLGDGARSVMLGARGKVGQSNQGSADELHHGHHARLFCHKLLGEVVGVVNFRVEVL